MQKNRIIEKLVRGGILTPSILKHYYRELCKATHPDLNRNSNEDFLRLQQEYREAREFLERHLWDYRGLKKADFIKLLDPRREFYSALHYYTLSGLHSVRIRNKKELQHRNRKILKEVLFWARWYDRGFIRLFIDYNRIFLRPPAPREIEKRLNKARRLFLSGLDWFFKYQLLGIDSASRTAESYLDDAVYEFTGIGHKFYKKALLSFALWVKRELELSPACGKDGA